MKPLVLEGETIDLIDLMDRGMDQLRMVWHAMHSTVLAEGDHEFFANALNEAIRTLEPVRTALTNDGAI